jgi:acyl carrier protein
MNQIRDNLLHSDVEMRVRDIISRASGEKLDPEQDSIELLNFDSLLNLEILTMLENEFEIDITENEIAQFSSVSKIIRLVFRAQTVKSG